MKLEVELRRDIGRAKWHVWHGNIHDALELLSYTVFGLEGCADNDARAKAVTLLHELHGYLERNQGSIPSYAERHRAGAPISRPLQIGGGSDFADCFDTSRRRYASGRPGGVTGFSITMPSPWCGGPPIQRCPLPICNGLQRSLPAPWPDPANPPSDALRCRRCTADKSTRNRRGVCEARRRHRRTHSSMNRLICSVTNGFDIAALLRLWRPHAQAEVIAGRNVAVDSPRHLCGGVMSLSRRWISETPATAVSRCAAHARRLNVRQPADTYGARNSAMVSGVPQGL